MSAAMHVLPSVEAAAEACARTIAVSLGEAIAARGRAMLAISGGSSPKALFAKLAGLGVDWAQVQLFWVDERCVPVTDDQSNYKMAMEHLIGPAGIPAANVHRVETELPPGEAAAKYAAEVEAAGTFDVIHLGMGPDAHTASLFPGQPFVDDREMTAIAVYVKKLAQWRVTLLPRVLLEARKLVVFAPGADKLDAMRKVFEGPLDPVRAPAQLAGRVGERTEWFTDQAL